MIQGWCPLEVRLLLKWAQRQIVCGCIQQKDPKDPKEYIVQGVDKCTVFAKVNVIFPNFDKTLLSAAAVHRFPSLACSARIARTNAENQLQNNVNLFTVGEVTSPFDTQPLMLPLCRVGDIVTFAG